MNRTLLSLVLIGLLPLSMAAQDDLYFTPKKSDKKVSSSYEKIDTESTYYSGSDRDVDEYNRHGLSSYFQKIGTDSLGNDIIEFHGSNGMVSDTLHVYPGASVNYNVDDDYSYSRRMSRYDDYCWSDPWYYSYGWYGYSPYWHARWGWYNPWYAGWYDPWYYGYGWHGWGYPYYYSHWNWGWSRPVYAYRGHTGTLNHGIPSRGVRNSGNGIGYRGNRNNSNSNSYNSSFNNRRNDNNGAYRNNGTMTRPSNNSGTFGGSRSGGNFGGGNRGGGSFGGGSRGGGGHFGGRR